MGLVRNALCRVGSFFAGEGFNRLAIALLVGLYLYQFAQIDNAFERVERVARTACDQRNSDRKVQRRDLDRDQARLNLISDRVFEDFHVTRAEAEAELRADRRRARHIDCDQHVRLINEGQ